MKEQKIYWLFADGSIAHIKGRPFSKAIAWKFELHHKWNYNMTMQPQNYYSI